jgi:class 3 adenylate cyclase/predicted ATPase
MVDVSRWLAEQGLGHYAEAFAENGIASDVLRDLTDADLRELGLNLGDRKRLLKAIAALAAGSADPRAETAEPIATPVVPREAERRQLTVLFCDLVGSTELSARLDPEDLRAIMGAYQAACAEVVGQFDGHVAKFLGDGVLVYFGWPRAHEDDAERAVRAGLQLVEAVARLNAHPGTRLEARAGIATGIAVVGDLVGEGAAREEAVVGETPNLAARLQALAAPGTVVISQATRRLVGGLFEFEDLGPKRLKGFAELLAAFRIAGKGRAEGRFEARQSAGLTPLVGRDEEIALLLRRWQQAREAEGQVVLLSGEPGIGKSRLVRELRARLADEPHVRLFYQCSSHHSTSPLHPLIEQLERAAGFGRDEPAVTRLAKLEALLARGTKKVDAAMPLIAALLSVPAGERYALPDLTPQRLKQLTLEALVDQLVGLAADQPVLLAYEDMHWSDPTTQELVGLTIERIQHLRVLVIMTFRPEFQPPWSGQPHVSTLALTRLRRRDGAAMVERVVRDKALPDEVAAQIVAKTDGVPLFVEELTKTVLESGLLKDAGDHWELSGPLLPLAIPATLHDSLLARLDRLAPVKEIAQIGAALGREFPHALLAAVADRPEAELQAALDQLVAAELVYRRGTPPDVTYSFKHALVQDAAYGTLLKSRRQQLHARIVQVLEDQFPEAADAQPELLGHHCTQAGLVEKAVGYWYSAAQLALARSAAAEAIDQLSRGLEILQGLPEGHERDQRELDLQVGLGSASLAAKGWGSRETGRAYTRAYELCQTVDDVRQRVLTLYGLFIFRENRAQLHSALELAEELLCLGRAQEDVAVKLLGHRVMGNVQVFLARFDAALPHLEEVILHYDPLKHGFPTHVPTDSRVSSRSFMAWALLYQGHLDRALREAEQALREARELGQRHGLAFGLHVNCLFHQVRGNRALVEERSSALVALAAERGYPHVHATGTFFHGWARAAGGAVDEGLEEMRRGLAAKQAGGAEIKVPYYLGVLGAAYARARRPEEALPLLTDAFDRVEETGERWFEAELHRRKGEVVLGVSEPDRAEAERCFHKAMAVAQAQGAKLWELRAATSLARLWAEQGWRAESHDLLAPVYGWFTEGFDTVDLRAAKTLLDELA